MKKHYQTPQIEVIALELEDAVLATSTSTDKTENVTGGYNNNSYN